MKQYCGHCGYLEAGNTLWCRKRGKAVGRAAAESPNRCHDFAYNPVDAFGENGKGYSHLGKNGRRRVSAYGSRCKEPECDSLVNENTVYADNTPRTYRFHYQGKNWVDVTETISRR